MINGEQNFMKPSRIITLRVKDELLSFDFPGQSVFWPSFYFLLRLVVSEQKFKLPTKRVQSELTLGAPNDEVKEDKRLWKIKSMRGLERIVMLIEQSQGFR
jgi:hypothetical protein